MKKSFSNITLIFTLPIKYLRRAKFDNFVGGLLIGAIFSLLVNIVTNQIGEEVSRQKSLEALEIEISNHHQVNTEMINTYVSGSYKKTNMYTYREYQYSENIWKSLASTTFFYSLDPKAQGLLLAYYSTIIDGTNPVLSKGDEMVRNYNASYMDCLFKGGTCEKELALYNKAVNYYTLGQEQVGFFTDKYDYELSQAFHPTRDRLSNPVLEFLMGKEAIKSLSLPWKPPTSPIPSPISKK